MVGRIGRLNFFIAILAALIVASTSWIFIPVLFGNQFSDAVPATQILAVGVIFISQRLVYSNYFKATDQMQTPIKAAWGGVVITILLDLLLIPRWGIIGASIATVMAYGFTSAFLVIKASSILHMSPADLFVLQKSDLRWLLTKTRKDEGSGIPPQD
jgi:O-antigen/teichoic acid export membrane protein